MRKRSLLIAFVFITNLVCAQGFNTRNRYSSIEIGLTNSYFLGADLGINSNRSFSPGFFVALMQRQGRRISNGIRFAIDAPTSRTLGRKDSLANLNFIYFQSLATKLELYIRYDLIEHRGKYQKRPDFVPYIHAGMGWMSVKQIAWQGYEEKRRVNKITNQRYQKNSLVLPLGIGLRYKLSKQTSLTLEVIYNYTLFNQLDLDYMHGFRNSKRKDSYLNVNLGISII